LSSFKIHLPGVIKGVKVISDLKIKPASKEHSEFPPEFNPDLLEKDSDNAYQKGVEEGRNSALAEYEKFSDSVNQFIQGLSQQVESFLLEVPTSILKTSIKVAEHLINSELHQNNSTIESIIHGILKRVPNLDKVEIRINPHDFENLQKTSSSLLDNLFIKFKPEEDIQPGGCIIESEGGIIDARLPQRVEEYLKYVGLQQEDEITL
jgi:flagellar biosynthesis/type III secretory pathway protein FliH